MAKHSCKTHTRLNSPSRAIPRLTKLEVRRRCGFGCVLCGSPLFQYDHLVEFSRSADHSPGNITLLCPNHHAEKTLGRIPLAVILEAHRNPFNLRHSESEPHRLRLSSDRYRVIAGKAEFFNDQSRTWLAPVMIDGAVPIRFDFSGEESLLNLLMEDRHGRMLCKIRNGELTIATNLLDFSWIGSELRVSGSDEDLFVIKHDPDQATLRIVKALLFSENRQIRIDDEGIRIYRNNRSFHFSGIVHNCDLGLCIGVNSMGYSSGVMYDC